MTAHPIQSHFLDLAQQADDLSLLAQVYYEAGQDLVGARARGNDILAAELELRQDDAAARFEKATGLKLSKPVIRSWRRRFKDMEALPFPSLPGPVVQGHFEFPAHLAPPSGQDAIGVFSVLTGARKAEKTIRVDGLGQVSGTTGKNPTETFLTAQSVGFATLEDVRHWAMLAQQAGGYLTRTPMRSELCPAARGVRRAYNANVREYGKLDHYGFEPQPSRLLVFDLDKITAPPDLDISDLDQLAPFALTFLPPEMADADFLLIPSSGHGSPASNGGRQVRLRVFALADRPITGAEYKAWLPQGSKVGADPALGSETQPIFILRNCVSEETGDWVEDPFEHLSWKIVTQHRRQVQMPETIDMTVVKPARKRETRQLEPRKPGEPREVQDREALVGDLRATLESIGDHEGGQGFHGPINRAIGQYWHLAAELDDETEERIVQELAAYIELAGPRAIPSDKPPEAYIAQLPSQVRAIRYREEQSRQVSDAVWEAVNDAVVDTPTLSADEAYSQVLTTLETLVDLALKIPAAWWDEPCVFGTVDDGDGVHFDYQPTLPVPQASPACAEIAAAVYELLPPVVRGPRRAAIALQEAGLMSPHFAMMTAVTVGVGKTTAAAVVANKLTSRGVKVAWGTADHELALQTAEKVFEMKTYRGLPGESEDPVAPGWCRNEKQRRMWQDAGGDAQSFCHGFCPIRKLPMEERCGYLQQEETLAGAAVTGFADGPGFMTRPMPQVCKKAGWQKPKVIFLDEPSMDKLVHHGKMRLDTAYQPLADFEAAFALRDKGASDYANARNRAMDIRPKVAAWAKQIERDFTHNRTVPGTKLTVARAKALIPPFSGRAVEALLVRPQHTELKNELLEPAYEKERRLLADHNGMMRELAKLATALRSLDLRDTPEHWVIPGWEFVEVNGKDDICETRFNFKYRADISADWEKTPVFMLDATAQDELVKQFIPGTAIMRFEAAERYTTRHVHLVASSKRLWTDRAAKIDAWAKQHCLVHGGDLVGVITHKEAADALRSMYRPEPVPYHLMHFNAVRGRNEMERVRVLGVFGRTLPSSEDIARTITALGGRVIREHDVERVPAAWVTREGDLIEGTRYSSPGELADAFLRNALEGGAVQADGRGRAVRRTAENPLDVHVYLDAVVSGLLVDGVAEETEFGASGGGWQDQVDAIWAAGVWPLTSSWRFWGAVWGCEPNAARQRVFRDDGGLKAKMAAWDKAAKQLAQDDKDRPVVRMTTAAGHCFVLSSASASIDFFNGIALEHRLALSKERKDACR